MAIYETLATGAGPINLSRATAIGQTDQLVAVLLHLSAAPTSAGAFTITFDSHAGAEYDTTLYSLDLSTGSTTDLFWQPDQPLYLSSLDAVKIAYGNPDARIYGVTLMTAGV